MGRKGKSGDGGGGGGGGGGGARIMGLRVIQCGRQTVHVVQPDGQPRQFVLPVTVSDVLHFYPHHFITHASPESGISGAGGGLKRSSGLLPLDTFLETGSIYVLHPLPRLFPSYPPPAPHFCSCYFQTAGSLGAIIKSELKRRLFAASTGGAATSKISPEDHGAAGSDSSPALPRRPWEPQLEIISEDKPLPATAMNTVAGEDDGVVKRGENKGKALVSSALSSLKLS